MRVIILSAIALSLTVPAQASAAQTWQQQSMETATRATATAPLVTKGTWEHFTPLNVHPDAKTVKFFANFIASGVAVNGLPCFNCVSGIPSALAIPDPFNYVPASTIMQYNLSWTNLLWSGNCTVSGTITSGANTIDSFSSKVPGVTQAGGYDWGWNRNRPNYSGPAVLTGTVKCGKTSSSVTANLIFQ